MADERSREDREETPAEKDSRQPVAGRQPQRPGQDGKYQPRPGERDAQTLPSAGPEGFGGEDVPRVVVPEEKKQRLGRPRADGE